MTHLSHSERTRTAAAVVGVVAWSALAALLVVAARDAGGGPDAVLVGVSELLRYFTVLTNLGVALAATVPLLARESTVGRFFRRAGTQTAVAASIAYVGVVYHLLLRRSWDALTLFVVADAGVHYATPVLFVAFWWYAVPKSPLAWRDALWWSWYPVAYFCYVLLRGASTGRYPYPFLDVGEFGYLGVVTNGLGLLVGFVAVAVAFVAVGRLDALRSDGT